MKTHFNKRKIETSRFLFCYSSFLLPYDNWQFPSLNTSSTVFLIGYFSFVLFFDLLVLVYAGPLPYHAIWQWPLPNVSACQQYGNQMSKRQQTSSDGTFTSTSIDGNWMNMRRETSSDGTLRQQQKIEIKWAIDHHQWLQKSYW